MHMLTSVLDTLHATDDVQLYPEESRGRKALWQGILFALFAQGLVAVAVIFLVRLFLHMH
jgi:hypothetical protein